MMCSHQPDQQRQVCINKQKLQELTLQNNCLRKYILGADGNEPTAYQ